MPRRHLTSVAVRLQGKIYLFDCGEGTQIPYKKAHLGLRTLGLVATTHLHADHVLGLPGVLMLRAQMPNPGPLKLLGTPGLRRFVKHVRSDLGMYINYNIDVKEWSPEGGELAYDDELIRLYWRPLQHSVTCVGYRLEEHERPGRFDQQAATALGIPRGPLWGRLQAGQEVQVDDCTIRPEQVLGPKRRGRCMAYVTDTARTPTIETLAKDVDIVFIESMFGPDEQDDAAEKKHLTVIQAAQAVQRAGARRAVLVHISPRYEGAAVKRLQAEARKHHPCIEVARDGQLYEVALPD